MPDAKSPECPPMSEFEEVSQLFSEVMEGLNKTALRAEEKLQLVVAPEVPTTAGADVQKLYRETQSFSPLNADLIEKLSDMNTNIIRLNRLLSRVQL